MYYSRTQYSILSPWGSLRFSSVGSGTYRFIPENEEQSAFIESLSFYKSGDIYKHEEVKKEVVETPKEVSKPVSKPKKK